MKSFKLLLTVLFTCTYLTFGQELLVSAPIMVAEDIGTHHPQIEFSSDNKALVTWTSAGSKDIFLAKHNGMDGFNSPIQLNPTDLAIQSYSWSGPDLAVENENVYVIFRSDGYESGHIYLVKSTDNAASFGDTVRVDNLAEGYGQYPDLAVLHDTIYTTFMSHNADGSAPNYVFSRSVDGGLTFESTTAVSDLLGAEACDCCPPEIIVNEEKVIIYYRNNADNIREIKAVVSYDRGVSFSDWFSVDDHAWLLMGCPSTGPDARFTAEGVAVSTYKTAVDGDDKIYFNAYDIDEHTTLTLQEIEADGADNIGLNYPQIASSDGQIGIVWESVETGKSTEIFFNQTSTSSLSFDSGNALRLTNLNSVQSKPDIAINNGFFHVVYANILTSSIDYIQIGEANSLPENTFQFELVYQPSLNLVSIQTPVSFKEAYTLTVYDLTGRIVHTENVMGNHLTQINTANYLSGTYIVQLSSSSEEYAEKFVK